MVKKQNESCYDDIINLPHHQSKKHPQMSMYNRAAQFAPFAALTGFEDATKETARLTDRKIDLSEDEINLLNEKLQIIIDNIKLKFDVTIIYFKPDNKKNGGTYICKTGVVRRVDEFEHTIIMEDKSVINIQQIYKIDSEFFKNYKINLYSEIE